MNSLLSALLGSGSAETARAGSANSTAGNRSARQQTAFAETLARLLGGGSRTGSDRAIAATAAEGRKPSSIGTVGKTTRPKQLGVQSTTSLEVGSNSDQQIAAAKASASGTTGAVTASSLLGETTGSNLQQSKTASQKKTALEAARGKSESRRSTRPAERAVAADEEQKESSNTSALSSSDPGTTVRATHGVSAATGANRVRQARKVIQSSAAGTSPAQIAEQSNSSPKGIANPKVSAVSLASTQASTPPVKELRSPERTRKQSTPNHAVSSTTESRQETATVAPLVPAALAARPAALAAPAKVSEASVHTDRVAELSEAAELPAEGAVLRNAAHLRIESPELGQIALHLRVRDGVAEVRFDGDKASALRERAPELARALAGEGLSLGKIDPPAPSTTTNTASGDPTGRAPSGWEPNGRGDGRKERDPDEAEPPSLPSNRTERSATSQTSNSVHVKA